MISDRSRIPAPPPRNPEAAFRADQSYPAIPVSTPVEDDPTGADQLGLTSEEIEHFRRNGYLIKRGLIPSEIFAPYLDLWWQQPPIRAAKMSPDDSATWISPGRFWPKDNRWSTARNWMGQDAWPSPEDDRPGANVGDPVGRLPHKLTHTANDVWRWHGIGHDPEFVDATTGHRMYFIWRKHCWVDRLNAPGATEASIRSFSIGVPVKQSPYSVPIWTRA